MHYSRVPSYYWKDRLYKLRYAGLNAVQTYVPWNYHEPFPGVYNFEGDHDLVGFIKTAQDVGLLVILRPGPYICAEWEMGGLPSWLLQNEKIVLRSSDSQYLTFVHSWMSKLLSLVQPLLYENGGPVIAVQVENEYGSYDICEASYLENLEALFREKLGSNVILFTTDGAGYQFLKCGTIPSLYVTVDFGVTDDPERYFKIQRQYQPHGPLVNSEFYTGWLDHWGEPHQRRDGNKIAASLDKILQLNASVNMYMFEGGTNFGFFNGANSGSSTYQSQPTSYDYNAPLTERGELTSKFDAIRNVVKKYLPLPSIPPPLRSSVSVYGDDTGAVYQKEYVDLFESEYMFTKIVATERPLSFEDMNQDYGFILYTTVNDILMSQSQVTLTVGELHDRVCVYWNKERVGTLVRTRGLAGNLSVTFSVSSNSRGSISLLVENMGRINFGADLQDRKGILNGVYLNQVEVLHWRSSSLPLNNTQELKFTAVGSTPPPQSAVFYRATFMINGSAPNDTYLQMTAWSKGVAFLNNFNLGRYWPAYGPQRTLYVPASVLKIGLNELVLFEVDAAPVQPAPSYGFTQFVCIPDLGMLVSPRFVEAERRF